MTTVDIHPEFGIELALTIPYAYYLHTKNSLKTVHTSKGMTPYYYFCDDVRETFEYRTIDNAAAGLNNLPNNWIHGIRSQEEPGVLDYKKWIVPPYEEYFKNGNKHIEGLYENDKKNGIWEKWNFNGGKISKGSYNNGKKN